MLTCVLVTATAIHFFDFICKLQGRNNKFEIFVLLQNELKESPFKGVVNVFSPAVLVGSSSTTT